MIDTSLYTYFTSNVPTFQVEEGKEDFDRTLPWIWYKRSSTIEERLLSGTPTGAFTSEFDVEMVSTDIDQVQAAADLLKTALQTQVPGSVIGATFVNLIQVEDHTDEYMSRTVLDTDAGYHLCTFRLRILHAA